MYMTDQMYMKKITLLNRYLLFFAVYIRSIRIFKCTGG